MKKISVRMGLALLALLCALFAFTACAATYYEVVFMNGNEVYATLTLEEGANIVFPDHSPTKEEDDAYTYEFVGWSTSGEGLILYPDGAEREDLIGGGTKAEGALTLHAVFRAVPKPVTTYTVTFRDGLTNSRIGDEQHVPTGGNAIPPEPPVHVGYTFAGWQGSWENVTERREIVAQYTPNKANIVWHYLGEEKEEESRVGASVDLEFVPSSLPEQLVFGGWYHDASCSVKAEEGLTVPAGGLDLYAQYTIDLGGVHTAVEGDGVYGGNDDLVNVVGLQQTENMEYTVTWNGGVQGNSYLVKQAGKTSLEAHVEAKYRGGIVVSSCTLEEEVTLQKAKLQGTISVGEEISYGTQPAPTLSVQGWLYDDAPEQIVPAYIYRKEGVTAEKFTVGSYTVEATAQELANYEVEIASSQFEVTPALLTATLSVQESLLYGEIPTPTLSFAGAQYGEDASALFGEPSYVFKEDGEVCEKPYLPVGEYTVGLKTIPKLENYTISFGGEKAFSVEKRPLAVTVTLTQSELTYGAHLADVGASLSYGELVAGDGEEALGLGAWQYTGKSGAANDVPTVGSYTVTRSAAAQNYDVTMTSASFTVLPASLTVKVQAETTYSYGNEVSPSLKVEGLVNGEREEDVFGDTLSISYEKDGEPYEKTKTYFDAGSYTANVDASGEHGNYTVQVIPTSFTVETYRFQISKTVKQPRETAFSFAPSFPAEEHRFVFHGTVELLGNSAGEHIATDGETFSEVFCWKEGKYSVTTQSGEDVTENFTLEYDLHVTLDASQFQVDLPENLEIVYDGQPHTYRVEARHPEESVQVKVEYQTNGGGYQTEAPSLTHAGEYRVQFRVSAENYDAYEGEFTVKISQAENSISADGASDGFTYDGSEHSYSFTVKATFGEVKASLNGEDVAESEGKFTFKAKDAGKYEITFTVEETDDFKGASTSVTVSVARAARSIKDVGVQKDFTYNGSASTGVIDESVLDYEGKGDGTLSVEGSLTFPSAGNYPVTVKVTGGKNYEDASAEITFVVHKGTYSGISHDPIQVTMKQGQTLSSVQLEEGYHWQDGGETVRLGAQSYQAWYNGDSENYEDFAFEITVTAVRRGVKIETVHIVETELGTSVSDDAFTYTLSSEGYELEEGEKSYLTGALVRTVSGEKNVTIGGTYLVNVTFTLPENDYYEITDNVCISVLKVKSVEYNGGTYTIEDALQLAESGTVTVKQNASFAAADVAAEVGYTVEGGHYTIKANVTLLLPYDEGGSWNGTPGKDGTTQTNVLSFGNANDRFVELTLPSGITLFNEGTLNVGGYTTGSGGGHYAGQTFGKYAQITLDAGAKIESSRTLNAYGFIVEKAQNNGSQVHLTAGTLTMPFVLLEFRGGSIFYAVHNDMQGSPFNRFLLHNVTAELAVEETASVLGHANLYTSSVIKQENTTDIKLIGNANDCLIQLQNGARAVAKLQAKEFTAANALVPTRLDIYGDMKFNSMKLEVKVAILSATVSTDGVMFPISYFYHVSLNAGASGTATVDATAQDIKVLPGGELTVGEGVTLNAKQIAVYWDADWTDVKVGASAYEKEHGDGKLTVEGTLHATTLAGVLQNASHTGAEVHVSSGTHIDAKELNGSSGSSFNTKVTWATISLDFTLNVYSEETQTASSQNGEAATYVWNGTGWKKN